MAKRWQQTWPRGEMVDHPAVIAETRRDNARTRPQLRHSDGLPIVLYQRPRVYVDRDAWEMLPPDGVLLMRVRPTYEAAFDLVFTPKELENVSAKFATALRGTTFAATTGRTRTPLVRSCPSASPRTAAPAPPVRHDTPGQQTPAA